MCQNAQQQQKFKAKTFKKCWVFDTCKTPVPKLQGTINLEGLHLIDFKLKLCLKLKN